MDFKLNEEQLMIQQAAKDFAVTELLPGVIERDEHSTFPTEQVKKMAELGFMGMMVDPKYGGAGLDSVSYVLAIEEIDLDAHRWFIKDHKLHAQLNRKFFDEVHVYNTNGQVLETEWVDDFTLELKNETDKSWKKILIE